MRQDSRNILKRTVAIIVVSVLLLVSSSEVFAKTKTVKALQCSGVFSENPATSKVHKFSEIPTVKSNTMVKTSSIDLGFVRYKVPKTGSYIVKITDFKCSSEDSGIYVNFSGNNFKDIKVSGLNNNNESFELFTSQAFNKAKNSYSSQESFRKSVEKREQSDMYYGGKSVTVKLKKGEYLYIQTWISGASKETIKGSYKVYIMKK